MRAIHTVYASFKARLQSRRAFGAHDRREARRTTLRRIQAAGVLVKIG